MEIDDKNFEEKVLKEKLPVLVDFWAPWCGPCRMVAPIIEDIADEYSGRLKVYKLNVDEASEAASRYGIMSIPTLAIFKDGEMVDSVVGTTSKRAIAEKIKPYLK